MITLLDGTKLPSHSELYTLWPKIEKIVGRALLPRTGDPSCYSEFEVRGWDIVLVKGAPNNWGNYLTHVDIEYKSNVTEWHKEIHQFLAQLNQRPPSQQHPRWPTKRVGTILLTFDHRFDKYRQTLATNNIQLVILPQSLLKVTKGDVS